MTANSTRFMSWGILLLGIALCLQRTAMAEGGTSIFDDPTLLPPTATAPTTAKPSPAPAGPATPATAVPVIPAPPQPTLLPANSGSATVKLALPETAARAKIVAMVKQIYASEYAQRTPTARRALAKELLVQADKIQSNFAAKYVLLEEAESAAAASGDIETCRKAIESIDQAFSVDTTGMIVSAVAALGESAADDAAIVDWAVDAANARIAQGDFKGARQIERVVSAKAGRTRNATSRESIKNVETTLADAERAHGALEKLKANPDDPAANLSAGRLYCFSLHDWARGLPMFVKCADTKLAAAATLDLTNPTEASKRYQVAGHWWDLAQDHAYLTNQSRLRERAAYWYQQAAPDLSGLQQALAMKRIEQAADDAAPQVTALRQIIFESYIDGDTEIHLAHNGIYLKQLAASKPGLNDGHNDPTYINGNVWKLTWQKPDARRGPDQSDRLPMMLGRLNFQFEILAISNERGQPGIQKRSPVTMREEGGEQIILIPDKQSGARWYTVRIFRK